MDECKLGVISQERLKIEVKLLLSANRKSYMPRRLAQQRMILSDLKWLHRALSLRQLSFLFRLVKVERRTIPSSLICMRWHPWQCGRSKPVKQTSDQSIITDFRSLQLQDQLLRFALVMGQYGRYLQYRYRYRYRYVDSLLYYQFQCQRFRFILKKVWKNCLRAH